MASEPIARGESFTVFVPEFERLVAGIVEEWKVPGLAVAVVQNGEVAFASPYGLRDVEAGLKVTTDTQFQLMPGRRRTGRQGPLRSSEQDDVLTFLPYVAGSKLLRGLLDRREAHARLEARLGTLR